MRLSVRSKHDLWERLYSAWVGKGVLDRWLATGVSGSKTAQT